MVSLAGATIWGTVYVLGRLHGLSVEEIREAVPNSTPLPQSMEDWAEIDVMLRDAEIH